MNGLASRRSAAERRNERAQSRSSIFPVAFLAALVDDVGRQRRDRAVDRATEIYSFGGFTLDARRRRLLARDTPVVITSRAFDLLAFLVRHQGEIVTRDMIIRHVRHDVHVGENNVSVQLSAVRRMLTRHGAERDMIVSLPGRGYCFVADIDRPADPEPDAPGTDPAPADLLPDAAPEVACVAGPVAAPEVMGVRSGPEAGATAFAQGRPSGPFVPPRGRRWRPRRLRSSRCCSGCGRRSREIPCATCA